MSVLKGGRISNFILPRAKLNLLFGSIRLARRAKTRERERERERERYRDRGRGRRRETDKKRERKKEKESVIKSRGRKRG